MRRRDLLALSLAALPMALRPAAAQSKYPERPIRLVIPFPPGGVYDAVGRPWADRVKPTLGTVVVENIGGAGGALGAAAVARAPSDGHTLLLGGGGALVLTPIASSRPPFDPVRDFEPIALLVTTGLAIVVHPALPAKTPMELVEYARKNPGKISFGSPGNGSSGHMVGEQFKIMHNLDLVHVPYKGAGPAVIDLVAGHIQMMFDIVPLAREQLLAGKVRALGVMSPKRLPVVPEVPTMAEQGMPELEGGPWFGLLAPAKTPRPIIDWLNAEAKKAMSAPDVRTKLETLGVVLPLGSPEDFRKHIADDTQRWGDIIKRAGIKL